MSDSICAQCKDLKNPVTAQNGGTLYRTPGSQKVRVADVHTECKAAWLSAHGAADFAGLEDRERTMKYDRRSKTSGQAIMEKLLLALENSALDANYLFENIKNGITTSLTEVEAALASLEGSHLIIRKSGPNPCYEFTPLGNLEVKSLKASRTSQGVVKV